MRATEMHDLLADVLLSIGGNVWHPGNQFPHIQYCRYCCFSESHGHGERCIIRRLEAATSPGAQHE